MTAQALVIRNLPQVLARKNLVGGSLAVVIVTAAPADLDTYCSVLMKLKRLMVRENL
jgi:hypothetical protein